MNRKKEKTQITKIRNESGSITTNYTEKSIKQYYEQLYANKLDNQNEMDKFLQTQNLPRLNHKEIENCSTSVTSNRTESVIKKLSPKEKTWTEWLH